MSDMISVLVVDDHDIVRKGIIALFLEVDDIKVVGEAANGIEAVEQAEALAPEVILMDMVMPKMDGVEAIRQVAEKELPCAIIALTSFATDDKIFPAIKAGALGYLLKDSSPDELITAIRQVHRGQSSLSPDIAKKVLGELAAPHKETKGKGPDPLSARELEVLRHVAKGLSNQEVADHLFISEPTVRAHMSNILSKLHLANRVQAALYALREGLTSLETEE